MKRVVLDQGPPTRAVAALQECGWDAVHVRDLGLHKASDGEILDYAASESRVVITLDHDFPQILALTQAASPSVVLIRQQRLRAPDLASLLNTVWRNQEEGLDRECVVTVTPRGTRTRVLPLT